MLIIFYLKKKKGYLVIMKVIWQAFKFFFGYFCTEGITREKEWILKMKTMIALQKGSLEDKVEDYLRIQKKKKTTEIKVWDRDRNIESTGKMRVP